MTLLQAPFIASAPYMACVRVLPGLAQDSRTAPAVGAQRPRVLRCGVRAAAQVAALAVLATPLPAHAFFGGGFSSAAIVAAINASAATISGAVGTAASTISTTFTTVSQTSTMQIVAAVKGAQLAQANVDAESAKQVSDTIIRVAATNLRGQIDRQSIDALKDPCSVVASTGMSAVLSAASPVMQSGGGVGREAGGTASAVAGAARLPGATPRMRQVLEVSKGNVAAPSPEATAAAAAAGACETFASAGVRASSCESAGLRAGNNAGLPDADIRADTIFDGPQGEVPRKRYSINLAGNDRSAVEAFMRNLNTPLPLRQLRPGELASERGHEYLALRDQYEARMSLAERPLRRHISRVSSTLSNVAYVQTLLDSQDRDFVLQFLAAHSPNWQREGISPDEMMQLEVRRRYMNGEWIKRMAFADPAALAAEQLRVSALSNVLLLQIAEELRETGVARAAADMVTIRTEMNPQLSAAHRAAAR